MAAGFLKKWHVWMKLLHHPCLVKSQSKLDLAEQTLDPCTCSPQEAGYPHTSRAMGVCLVALPVQLI